MSARSSVTWCTPVFLGFGAFLAFGAFFAFAAFLGLGLAMAAERR